MRRANPLPLPHIDLGRSIAIALLIASLAAAQSPPPAKKAAPSPAAGGAPQAAKPVPQTKPRATRPPLTRAEVEKLWKQQQPDLILNEIRLRNLGFEPEEAWVSALAKDGAMPAVLAELQQRIPPAPTPEDVAAAASNLIPKLKTAAQSRNEEELKGLLHPDLLTQKAKVYDLFDKTNYRDHTLGRFLAQPNRTVGVQFFQLTNAEVERLHYITFASSYGKIVVRDVVTGPAVAKQYLADETELAKSKLDLVFRAMNDGDESGLRSLCTPGLFDSIKELAGGARLTRGVKLTLPQMNVQTSAELDQKSIRVVARTMFSSPSGRRIEFDVDFERINNDLKIVRVRDVHNKVIAWDPDIDNYLRRRYGMPDGPRMTEPLQGKTELLQFLSLDTIRQLALNSILFDQNAQKVGEFALEMLESQPNGGEGYGLRASANHLMGKYDEVERDAMTAIERGGTVYFPALHHKTFKGQEFWPVVLAVSKGKLVYMPAQGAGAGNEEIEIGAIDKFEIETLSRVRVAMGEKPRPFFKLEFRNGTKKEGYNFAAVGTYCPVGATQPNTRRDLIQWTGGSVCPVAGQAQNTIQIPGARTTLGPMFVPRDWQRNLTLIQRSLAVAGRKSATAAR